MRTVAMRPHRAPLPSVGPEGKSSAVRLVRAEPHRPRDSERSPDLRLERVRAFPLVLCQLPLSAECYFEFADALLLTVAY